MSIPVFNNTWIWFVVMTIFRLLSIAHSSCDDLCYHGLVDVEDENDLKKMVDDFSGYNIECLDTTKITDMNSLFDVERNEIFKDFNEDIISCWDTSGVTDMQVSR